jgi:hypothetical protein
MDSHKALWLRGGLFDFDRDGALDEDANELLASSPSVGIIVTHKLANP